MSALIACAFVAATSAFAVPSTAQPGDIEWKFSTYHVITAWKYSATAPDEVDINAVDDPTQRQIELNGQKTASDFAARYVNSGGVESIFIDMPFDRLSQFAAVAASGHSLGINIAVRPTATNSYSFVYMTFYTGASTCPPATHP